MRHIFYILGTLLLPLILTSAHAMENNKDTQTSTKLATFAGGCFWCMEPPFDQLSGVISTTSGYSGGSEKSPNYQEVSAGKTHHAEVVQVRYNSNIISYAELLEVFWRNIDPTSEGRQFVDIGQQYRSAIFYHSEEQRKQAIHSRNQLVASGRFSKPIVTEITAFSQFYPAEDYHQDYYQRNPIRYKYYRYRSGRDQFLEKIWTK